MTFGQRVYHLLSFPAASAQLRVCQPCVIAKIKTCRSGCASSEAWCVARATRFATRASASNILDGERRHDSTGRERCNLLVGRSADLALLRPMLTAVPPESYAVPDAIRSSGTAN